MLERRSVDFKNVSVVFTCACSNVLCVAIVTSWGWMGLWRHCWRRQWLGRVHCADWEWNFRLECPLRFTPYFVLFSQLFYIPCYKRDQEWLPVHCGDQRHAGLCLGYVPALAYGSCRVSDQGTTLRASDLHNARATILNPFNITPLHIYFHVTITKHNNLFAGAAPKYHVQKYEPDKSISVADTIVSCIDVIIFVVKINYFWDYITLQGNGKWVKQDNKFHIVLNLTVNQ